MIRIIVFFILLSAQSFGQNFVFPAVYAPPGPPPTTPGVRTLIYDDFSGSSLNSRWNVRRPDKQTITVSGGFARVTTNTDTIPAQVGFDYSYVNAQCMIYDTSYGVTSIRNYTEEIGFRVNKLNDTTLGVILGCYSPFPSQYTFTNFMHAQMTTADTLKWLGGKDTMFSVPPGFKPALTTFSFNTTDDFLMRYTVLEGVARMTLKNVTTGDSLNTDFTFQMYPPNYPARSNYFYFAFGGMGRDDISFDYIHVTTTEELNPTHMFVGNSITTGYDASADSAYANMLKRSTADSIQIFAGGGLGVDEILVLLDKIHELNPQYVFFNIGTNNTYNPTYTGRYEQIIDSLVSYGITVFPCFTPNGGDPDTGGSWNQFIKTTYASTYIDLWTAGWNTMTIGNGEMYDTVHPTEAGKRKLVEINKSLKPIPFAL